MEPIDRIERALETLSRDAENKARQIGGLADNASSLDRRVTALELAEQARAKEEIREEERNKATVEWRDGLATRLAKMEANYEEGREFITKLLFRFIVFFTSAIGLAVLAYIAKKISE